MSSVRSSMVCAAAATAVAWAAMVQAGRAQPPRQPLVLEPLGASGEAIFPAFEGWGPHKDGTTVLLLGYYNRNRNTSIDIPVGPDNRIEPGGPDYGQPTYFAPSRQHGVFAIRVPKDFGARKLTWTISVNGQTSSVTFWLNPPYWIDFFRHAASGNQPPVARFGADGPTLTGPPLDIAQTLAGRVGEPVALKLWASDSPPVIPDAEAELAALRAKASQKRVSDPVAIVGGQVLGGDRGTGRGDANPEPDITVNWKKHRGPGGVTFAQNRIPLRTNGDLKLYVEATTSATFAVPGEYILRAQINDQSGDGGGGDQCCWTTAHVKVNVK